MRFIPYLVAGFLMAVCSSCSESGADLPDSSSQTTRPGSEEFVFAKGADISWLTEMESEGVKFFFPDGEEGDCIRILKGQGMNCLRFRVWVNPENEWNSTEDVVAKCRRAVAEGMDVMIDFHYSDSWADPGKQNIPQAWKGFDADQLVEAVGDYTESVLAELREAGVAPKWVQIGNETTNGMLWPYGQADKNPADLARMINSAYTAIKKVFPDALAILHIDRAQENSLYRWFFDLMKTHGARYDIIGMSLYPEPENYKSYVRAALANMQDCIERYDKDVMLCEVGMGEAYPEDCRAFLTECLSLAEQLPAERFLGVLYWEPQCYNSWHGYKKGAFTANGRPSAALGAFGKSGSGITPVLP